ncbi:DNA primase [Microbacterium sp. JB110]|uniref:DNA primase n=1 Tax=Microbacterium sp. JB110 TaxID=2024477 RepID=UPI00097EBB9D|nr:DNA primase [Microbacterium sp. JB110]RCS63014.1 DNA primase [Microbacterium sp. JB110]SJM60717.1 DNA primase [Frigoribacterium sp. JB110]
MPRIRQADVEEVKSRTNIADVIGERVALKTAGIGSMKGLCPFHDEKSPSFHVRPQHGYYHCFGCGESGDVYSFLREMDHMSFTEAVERLAARIGFPLHYEEGGGPAPETSGRSRLLAVNKAAADYFRSQLGSPGAEIARRFLGERGFDPAAAAHFGVGFAPQGWDHMLKALGQQGFTREEMIAAGVVSQNQRGGVYDRFRGRVVWPIRDVTGQTIGFGARRLFDDDKGPKYLNTPETAVYKKNQVLYGLDLAKRDISRGEPKRVVVVEGYTDVMACHLAGITTAIATCGTAFGSEHVTVLRRVMGDDSANGEVIFTFDPDEAGQKAAVRAFAEEKRFNAQSYVAVAPDGLDPCDLRLQRGDSAVKGLIEQKKPMFEFMIDRRISGFDLATVEGRVGALRSGAPIVAEIRDRLLRPGYERVLALRLGMDPADVHREVEGAARQARRTASQPQRTYGAEQVPEQQVAAPAVTLGSLPPTPQNARERDALTGFLQYGHRVDPELFVRALAVPFHHPALEGVRVTLEGTDRTKPGWALTVVETAPSAYATLAGELLARDFPARDEEHAVSSINDLARQLIIGALLAQKNQLLGAIQRVPADSEEGRALRMQLRDLDAQKARLTLDD